jgi:hypothetical protein
MGDEGYYELQVLDHAGWSLRSRFPGSEDDPLVLMRARAEAEQVTQEPNIRGVELVHEFLDTQTNEIKREAVYTWGNQRVAPVSAGGGGAGGGGGGVASTPQSRRKILRAARASGRLAERSRPATRPGRKGRPTKRPKDEPDPPVAAPTTAGAPGTAPRPRRVRRRRPWWRSTTAAALGSLLAALGAGGAIWLGLSKDLSTAAALDTQPVQAGLLTVILLGAVVALVVVSRRGIGALFDTTPAAAPASADGPPGGPAELAVPAPVAPMGPKPKPMAPEDAVVEVQQNRLLRFLRECMLHKDMQGALSSDGTLRDPHVVYGCHLFLLGAAEVCVTDTSSGISDTKHLVRVMKALMRAIGSPEDRAEAFVGRIEQYRKKPEEHTMILLGQLAMDHYLEHNQAPDGALSQALIRWSSSPGD